MLYPGKLYQIRDFKTINTFVYLWNLSKTRIIATIPKKEIILFLENCCTHIGPEFELCHNRCYKFLYKGMIGFISGKILGINILELIQ